MKISKLEAKPKIQSGLELKLGGDNAFLKVEDNHVNVSVLVEKVNELIEVVNRLQKDENKS